MRKIRQILIIMILVGITLSMTSKVYAYTYKGYSYKKIDNGKNIQITSYKGTDSKITVPDKIGSKKVTNIAFKALVDNKKVKTVIIPDTVKRIGSYALGYDKKRNKISGFTIVGSLNTAAYRYAKYNGITFRIAGLKGNKAYSERIKKEQVKLKWNAQQCDGYVVYRADSTKKNYKKIATVTGTEYTDDSIKDGNVYYYKIKPYKVVDDKKIYGDFSSATSAFWGRYNKATFEFVKRNKVNMSEKQGVYYEIFVRSFADSDGDGIGDFNGVTQKLDYLKELGIDGIWLMPVNASDSYHGYDVNDYYALNSDYGTEEDFKNLIEEAHKRDIKIIMDFVINHTSNSNPWFVSACNDVNSKYRDYYRFVSKYDTEQYNVYDESPWGSDVWQSCGDYYYYSAFYGFMPDLNYNNKEVRKEIKSAAGKWLQMGIDGFRLDAAMHVYGDYEFRSLSDTEREEANIQWWNEFASYCEGINPNVYLVGEAWQNDEVLEKYVQPFDTKFNFTLQQNLTNAVVNESIKLSNGDTVSKNLEDILKTYTSIDSNYIDGIFGSNHDQNRIMSTVKGNEAKAKLIASIYMTLPGNPYIYYGEELGMRGEGADENKRTPFLWGTNESADSKDFTPSWESDSQNKETVNLSEQMKDENSMYNFYKELIALRKSHKALNLGTFKSVNLENDLVMAYERECDEEKLLVLHNLSGNDTTTVVKTGENEEAVVLKPYETKLITRE